MNESLFSVLVLFAPIAQSLRDLNPTQAMQPQSEVKECFESELGDFEILNASGSECSTSSATSDKARNTTKIPHNEHNSELKGIAAKSTWLTFDLWGAINGYVQMGWFLVRILHSGFSDLKFNLQR